MQATLFFKSSSLADDKDDNDDSDDDNCDDDDNDDQGRGAAQSVCTFHTSKLFPRSQ